MARVAIVIPNYNGVQHLPECLRALAGQTFKEFEVVVVDNASTDDSISLLQQTFPLVRIIALSENRGFSAAANAGVLATTEDLVVLLNNDTCANDDWLERLVGVMDDTPEAGSGASKLVRYDDPLTLDAAGDTFVPSTLSGMAIGRGEPASRYSERSWVFGACAAAAIYRRQMIEDIGLFDDDFFLTHEDVDLSMRAQLAGYRCVYVPDAVVRHKRRATYRLESPEIEAIGLRNRLWVVGKNVPLPLLARWTLIASPHVVATIIRKLVRGRRIRRSAEQSGAAWSAEVLRNRLVPVIWAGLRSLPAKRRAVRHTRRVSSRALLRVIRRPHEPAGPRFPA